MYVHLICLPHCWTFELCHSLPITLLETLTVKFFVSIFQTHLPQTAFLSRFFHSTHWAGTPWKQSTCSANCLWDRGILGDSAHSHPTQNKTDTRPGCIRDTQTVTFPCQQNELSYLIGPLRPWEVEVCGHSQKDQSEQIQTHSVLSLFEKNRDREIGHKAKSP